MYSPTCVCARQYHIRYRVEFPTHITDHGRMNMLLTWIVDHPQAAQEEDARARREQVRGN